ncbi:TetR/AcrR family transcriptional regulator [Kineococcus esterisolvens]|uniref:TetR/AcrR family transcriptional regulator n=1 Tax=unclassified Kineococcus TaxID=2621656 RepID=UPI003D7EE2D9
MPKLIDHAAREVEVAEAAWRVAVRDGVRGLSVRAVAAEAGLATASLRRAFPTQASLLAHCLELVRRRAGTRLARLPHVGGVDSALALLTELLPLDAEHQLEMEVQVVLSTAALTGTGLRPVADADAAHDDVARACRHTVDALISAADGTSDGTDTGASSRAGGGLDADTEAAHLHALLDGLALHLVRRPEREPADRAVRLLRHHLEALTTRAAIAG